MQLNLLQCKGQPHSKGLPTLIVSVPRLSTSACLWCSVQPPAVEWLLPSFPGIYLISKWSSVLTCFTGGTYRTGDWGSVLSSYGFSNRGGVNEHENILGALAKGVVAGFSPSTLEYHSFIHSHSNCLLSVMYLALCSHLSPDMGNTVTRIVTLTLRTLVEGLSWARTKSFNKSFILLNPPHNPANRYYYDFPLHRWQHGGSGHLAVIRTRNVSCS